MFPWHEEHRTVVSQLSEEATLHMGVQLPATESPSKAEANMETMLDIFRSFIF
jgi:hypothetical protein